MTDKKCVLEVDVFDNPIGTMEKMRAHTTPVLHRAFSVFLHDGKRMLVQKRAESKYHSGGLWANACCSHPLGDNIKKEAQARLGEELGISEHINLDELFSFTYLFQFAENLFEYEFDHVFVGKYSGKVNFDQNEVSQIKWIDFDELENQLLHSPEIFVPWFVLCAPKVISLLKS